MKLNLKMIAIAAAIASMAGAAHANLTSADTGNGSLVIVAFSTTSNRNLYIRDTGLFINDFVPSTVTTLANDGNLTGNKTPETGLLLNKNTSGYSSFADSAFSGWLAGQTPGDVRWFVTASDSRNLNATNVARLITSSANPAQTVSNGQLTGYASSGNAGNLNALAGGASFGLSFSSMTGAPSSFDSLFGLGASGLATLDQSVGLFYASRHGYRSVPADPSTSASATSDLTQFGNSAGFATVSLASNGDFTYSLAGVAAPVPEPSTVWLMGAGLIGAVGALRRRKSADQA